MLCEAPARPCKAACPLFAAFPLLRGQRRRIGQIWGSGCFRLSLFLSSIKNYGFADSKVLVHLFFIVPGRGHHVISRPWRGVPFVEKPLRFLFACFSLGIMNREKNRVHYIELRQS